MEEGPKRLLEGLRQSLAREQKSAALTVYPDQSPGSAESRMSRLLSGEFGDAVWRAIDHALRVNPTPFVSEVQALARRDADELRERAVAALEASARCSAEALEMLREADEIDSPRIPIQRSRPRPRGREDVA